MDMDLLKDLPGFQGVFKAVINSQMKLLIEQLSTHGSTETIILTVNLSDGTLSELGSKTAKGFLEGRDEMKVQFLSHCLNSHLCRNKINSDGKKTKEHRNKRLFQDKGYYIDTVDQDHTQPKCDSDSSVSAASSWHRNQIPESDLVSSQNIIGGSISEYNHDIQPTTRDSNSDNKESLPDNFDTSTETSQGNEETDYIIEENIERTDGTVDRLSAETKENIILEPVTKQEQSNLETDLVWIKTEPAIDDSVTVQCDNIGFPGAGEEVRPNVFHESVVNDTGFAVKRCILDIIKTDPAQYNGTFKDQPKTKPCSLPKRKADGKFECEKCGKSFKTHQNLQVHDRGHLGIRPFRCDVCDQRFFQSSHLRTHMLKHSGLRRFSCSYCPLKFYTRSNLRVHERIHTGEKPYKCKHCGKAFTHSASVPYHIIWHHQDLLKDDLEKGGIVPDGSDLSRNIDSTNRQIEIEMDYSIEKESTNLSSEDQTSVQCEESVRLENRSEFESYPSKERSNTHTEPSLVKDGYVKDEPFSDVDTASQKESAKMCRNKCQGGNDFPVLPVAVVGEAGNSGFGLDSNQSGQIPVSELYADVLNAQARTSNGKKRKQTDRKFKCKKCGKSFKSLQNLQVHDRIHSGIRPFNCDICDQRFSQRTHLQTHIRIHTGERPYACSFCPQMFTTSSHQRSHERTHTGQKPNRCRDCGKNFTQSSSLSSHIKKMHQC